MGFHKVSTSKVPVRPLKRPIKGVPVGEIVMLEPQAAHVFVAVGRAELVVDEPEPVIVEVEKPKRRRNYKRRDMRADG